jgi:hypothetical protein
MFNARGTSLLYAKQASGAAFSCLRSELFDNGMFSGNFH